MVLVSGRGFHPMRMSLRRCCKSLRRDRYLQLSCSSGHHIQTARGMPTNRHLQSLLESRLEFLPSKEKALECQVDDQEGETSKITEGKDVWADEAMIMIQHQDVRS